jgi:hypothetical protein
VLKVGGIGKQRGRGVVVDCGIDVKGLRGSGGRESAKEGADLPFSTTYNLNDFVSLSGLGPLCGSLLSLRSARSKSVCVLALILSSVL